MPSIEELIPRVEAWKHAKNISSTLLPGGITNLNYRVDVDGNAFVVRIGGEGTQWHGIERAREYACHTIAASLGIAPPILAFIEPEGYLITRFIPGRKISPEEMCTSAMLSRVAAALHKIHDGRVFPGEFSAFRVFENYLQTARRFNAPLPKNIDEIKRRVREIESATSSYPRVPCHNDLLNENFLDDGLALWVLDWEYAAMGDVFFDLANFADHHEFKDEAEHSFLAAYFGRVETSAHARLKLMRAMSQIREAMWGVAQTAISKLDFDFGGYADKFFTRFQQTTSDPCFHEWLHAVAQS